MLLYLHASFVNKWECSAYLKMSKYSGLLIAGTHMTLIHLEWLASLGSSLGWMCVNEYTMHMPAHTLACAHTLCTRTMHTGLITLANVIHSLMNVLHTPDMEPISVRNKPEYLSTAAGCKPWRIEHVLPKPGCSFIRIIKFLKGLDSCQVYLYTYTLVEVGDTSKRCFDTILSICMVYLQYENTIPALPFRKIEISVQGKKKTMIM